MCMWPVINLRTFIFLTFCLFPVNFLSMSGAIMKAAKEMWLQLDTVLIQILILWICMLVVYFGSTNGIGEAKSKVNDLFVLAVKEPLSSDRTA